MTASEVRAKPEAVGVEPPTSRRATPAAAQDAGTVTVDVVAPVFSCPGLDAPKMLSNATASAVTGLFESGEGVSCASSAPDLSEMSRLSSRVLIDGADAVVETGVSLVLILGADAAGDSDNGDVVGVDTGSDGGAD